MLTRDRWKLIAYRDGRHELFQLDKDEAEAKDLFSQHPRKVKELSQLLKEWKAETGIPF